MSVHMFIAEAKSNPTLRHHIFKATLSRFLRGHEEGTKTAVALPRCSESTKDSIAGWWDLGSTVWRELWQNFGMVL